MTKFAIISTLFVLLVSSCKVTENDIIGSYQLDRSPKTTLKINSDKTFEFSKNNRNPYLHPFDHPDEYFADTKGTWQAVGKKTIALTSQRDTLTYPLVSVVKQPARDNKCSHFTFYDKYGDTVKVLYVQYTDSSISAKMHRSMDYFTQDLTKRDTLEFHFYGYRPYVFIGGQNTNQDYIVTLKPSFQPNFFRGTEFRIKRKQLTDIERKGNFTLTERGM
ncbi:MAG: hypothetical protein IPG86_02930 [Chitinophagaceae bacterium]|nr:hypothetical protein [Chitinophagaceae bacterium]